MKRTLLSTSSLSLFLFAIAGPCGAQDNTATNDSNWHVAVSPYLWLTGVSGIAGAQPLTVGVQASPADLLSHFRFGLMGFTDISYKRFLAPIDLIWVRLGDDQALPPTLLGINSANFKANETILTPKIGFRVIDSQKLKIDALTGFRYWYLGETLNFSPSILGKNFHQSQDWTDPLVGGRIRMPLSPKVAINVAGDVGGWGVGSQIDYQIAGVLSYRMNPKWNVEVGWRYLYVNYRETLIFDAHMAGVFFGATYNIK